MDLRAPIHFGGEHYLTAVTVGRDPDDRTARDCPACGGYLYDDEWHLVATVRTAGGGRDRAARHYFCSDDCLRGWIRTFPATR